MDNITKEIIGASFEDFVTEKLYTKLQSEFYIIQSLPLYSCGLHKVTEVDILLVTRFGIFCLECKNVRTSIKGNYEDKMWTTNSGRYYNKMFNPSMQNRMHIRALKRLLRSYTDNIPNVYNFVVIPNHCKYVGNCPEVKTVGCLFAELQHLSVIKEKTVDVKYYKEILKNIVGGFEIE